jgi:transposase-like protein
MKEQDMKSTTPTPAAGEGGRRPSDAAAGAAKPKRWSARRKREAVMRLLRGESLDALSRELGVETYRLESWRDKALNGMDEALKSRDGDPLQAELDKAMKRIGEITMDNELLLERCRRQEAPFRKRRRK